MELFKCIFPIELCLSLLVFTSISNTNLRYLISVDQTTLSQHRLGIGLLPKKCKQLPESIMTQFTGTNMHWKAPEKHWFKTETCTEEAATSHC